MKNSAHKMRLGTAVLLGVLLAAGITFGQGNPTSEPQSFKDKSPVKAFRLSLLGAALPVVTPIAIIAGAAASDNPDKMSFALALIFATMGTAIIGPSPGYFYAGLFGQGLLGMGIRAAGIAIIFSSFTPESGFHFGGLAVVIGSTIWGLVRIKSAVNKRNERKRTKSLNISPLYIPQSKTYGVSLQIQF